jgi:tetratricopeptide (TPR) repeat protein
MSVAERIQKLLEALHNGLYVILLDHMEDLLDDDGRIVDEELATFIEQSLIFPHNARLMITSRTSLAFRRSTMRFDKQLPLPRGLSVSEGVAMLRELDPAGRCGLQDAPEEDLARAVRHVHGVPRALEILAGIMAYDPLATLDDILDRFYENPDVVNDLIKEGYKLLGQDARRVMEALAVFRRPVPAAAVDFLLEPFVPGLDLPNILRRLVRSQVVKTDRAQGTMFIQPIEQDYAYQQCPQTEDYNCRMLEVRAAAYWARLRPPTEHWKTAAGLSPLIYEFEHLVRAAEYDRAAEVLGLFDLDYLIMRGHARQALSMRMQLDGMIQDRRQRMLHELGLARAHTLLGPLPLAIDHYTCALKKARELGDRVIEAETLGWLGEVHRRSGKLDSAYKFLNSCLTLLREDGDQRNETRWLAEMTLICIYRGDLSEALGHGRYLMEMAQKVDDSNTQALANDALSLAYLVLGQPEKAEDYADKALALYRESKWEHELVYVMNVQGMARIAMNRLDDGITRLQEAQKIAHEDNNTRAEGYALFNLARAFRMKKELNMAFEAAKAARNLFSDIEAGGAEAAGDLLDVITAARADNRWSEAKALLECAEHSLSIPDFLNPRDLVSEACRIAEADGMNGLIEKGRAIVDKIAALGRSTLHRQYGRNWP